MKSKKNTTIGMRVDDNLYRVIERLANNEDRPLAAMSRRLVEEALQSRGLIKSKKK